MLTPDQLRSRLALDWRVIEAMACPTFVGHAYATRADLDTDHNRITSADDGHRARFYRLVFNVPTLAKGGALTPRTDVGVDLGVAGYPIAEPTSWCLTSPSPWSPHFEPNSGSICTGTMWQTGDGEQLLGHLVVHIARLLNWQEDVRGGRPSYNGYNAGSIDHWLDRYQARPLNPELRYPVLPAWLFGQVEEPQFEFVSEPQATFEWQS